MSKIIPPCNCRFDLNHVQKTILRYFGSIPSQAKELGYVDGESLVCMGNGLLWIAGDLDEGPSYDQPVSEVAVSIKALSQQFQEVGREIWDFDPAKNSGIAAKVHRLEFQVRTLQRMVALGGSK